MNNKPLQLAIALLCLLHYPSAAQTPFNTMDSLDINKINALITVHGDMWENPVKNSSFCKFPKGDSNNVAFKGALWIAAYDAGGNLHVSAQTYRQNGNDYWPGPLDASDTLTYANSQAWARIWKVDYNDIYTFLGITTHTVLNTPKSILEWPGKGNPYAKGNAGASLTITTDMAPFTDVDGDGIYNPLKGDYPVLKGDQMLWWVFSDNGPAHTESKGRSLKLEIHATAYAYNRPGALQNIQYYEYQIANKGTSYHNFRVGLYADMDNGWAFNDYIGFDSARRLGYDYNAYLPDSGGTSPGIWYGYGHKVPVVGTSIIVSPGDGSAPVPAGSFMYYNNDFTPEGNPNADSDYYHYLNASWRNGAHLKNDFAGRGIYSTGTGTGPNANYVFPGDPSDTMGWSECNCNNIPYDRRYIIASGDYNFPADSTTSIVFALVVTDTSSTNTCPLSTGDLKALTDSSWHYYKHPLPIHPAGVENIAGQNNEEIIYPNPASTSFTLVTPKEGNYYLYNLMGLEILEGSLKEGKNTISIETLPVGMYECRIIMDGEIATRKIAIIR